MKTKKNIIVYTDGGSRGNPGRGAIGVVVRDGSGSLIKSYGRAIGIVTNNEAEYAAVVFALQKIKALLGGERSKKTSVTVHMDSELVARQLSGKYKIEEERLFAPFIKIWNLKMDFGSVAFTHVPREQNRDADRLVNEALDQEQESLFSRQ
ncbi:MAG: ribonuclease HI family protein [Candidatus Sungbacteria bacterium]|uniref:Ribonuclease HI family protein n=1 Tax=Candidatus Sungiibacteriota bacterium TaxID=2750080 RepID=A0A932QY77_9BACT|nr:ribonuclease HI family protein [Candidatus Sungbacteria bacterium]